ncbi:hypothetical protein Tco_1071787 [Tanacetum coccineum]
MLTAIAERKWIIGHSFRVAKMKCAYSVECRPALGKVISMAINKGIQQGLEAGIKNRKAGRTLSQVEAYDPAIETKYVAAVKEFKNVSFSLLEELEALKDSSLTLLMSTLTLEDDHSDVDPSPELHRLQPAPDQVTVPIYDDQGSSRGASSIIGEMLLSDAIAVVRRSVERRKLGVPSSSAASGPSVAMPSQDNALVVADYQISSVAIDDATHISESHYDLFYLEVLDKTVDT